MAEAPNTDVKMERAVIPQRVVLAYGRGDAAEALRYAQDVSPLYRPSIRDRNGRTLVHLAALSGSPDIIRETTDEDGKLGLPVNVVDYAGNHPLHTAAAAGHMEALRALLQIPDIAPLWTLNSAGCAPADLAETAGFDYVASFLRDQPGGAIDKREGAVQEWPQRFPLLDPTTEAQLVWRDVEAAARLLVALPSSVELPWTSVDVDALGERAELVLVHEPPKLVAGMLLIAGEYQFDGMYFRVALDVNSPHGTGTRLTVYESLAPPKLFLEVYEARMPAQVLVLRLYATPGGKEVAEIAPDLREPEAAELRYFARCGPQIRQTLLSIPLYKLAASAVQIRNMYRWYHSLKRFRQTMAALVQQVGKVKSFLRRTRKAKHLSIVGLDGSLRNFEKYCLAELRRIDGTVYPTMVAALESSSSSRRQRAIRKAIATEKARYVDRMRGLDPTAEVVVGRMKPFRYAIAIETTFAHWAATLDVEAMCRYLLSRKSYLPRATIMAMQKRQSNLSVTDMAQSRMASVMSDLFAHYLKRTSYASEKLEKMRTDVALQEFKQAEALEHAREARRNAAMVSAFIHRLSEKKTGRSREQKRREAAEAAQPQLISIRDVVRPHPPPLTSPTSHDSGASRREKSSQRVALICSSRSPVPSIIGNKQSIKKLLVRFTEDGEMIRPAEDPKEFLASLHASIRINRAPSMFNESELRRFQEGLDDDDDDNEDEGGGEDEPVDATAE